MKLNFRAQSLNLIPPVIDLGSTAAYIDHVGTTWMSGINTGRFGNGTTTNATKFTQILGSYKQVCTAWHTVMLDNNGTVWCSGLNNVGQLGNGTNVNGSSPTSIVRSASYTQISCGSDTSFAIDGSNGMVYGWGSYGSGGASGGTLGDNTKTNRSSPVAIARSASYSYVYTNNSFSGAIDGATGQMWVWGSVATVISTGDGTTAERSSPVSLKRAGSYKTFQCNTRGCIALDATDGSLWVWGLNSSGLLGTGFSANISSPVSVIVAGSFTQIATTSQNTYALNSDGVLYGWGSNIIYQFQSSNINLPFSSPVSIMNNVKYIFGTKGDYIDLAFNSFFIGMGDSLVFIKDDGGIWAWSNNSYGQLGNGDFGSTFLPVSRSISFKKFVTTNTIFGTTLALDYSGNAYAWGAMYGYTNFYGEFGTGSFDTNVTPRQMILRPGSYSDVFVGSNNFFVDGSDGSIWGAGYNGKGNLGDGSITSRSSPVSVLGGRRFRNIVSCVFSSGGIDVTNGMVYTWGSNQYRALGDNTGVDKSSPVAIARSGSYTQLILAGNNGSGAFLIALDGSTGQVYTWGAGTSGQLGNNSNVTKSSPVAIARSSSFTQITGGNIRAAVLDGSNGMVYTWGPGANGGSNGDNTVINRSSPVAIARSASYCCLAGGTNSFMAIDGSTGSIWGWGDASCGQLGVGTEYIGALSSPTSMKFGRSAVSIWSSGRLTFIWDYEGQLWTTGDSSAGVISANGIYTSPVSIGKAILK
jgi:alpha-tubulin suppressor-like RCC1 family protein